MAFSLYTFLLLIARGEYRWRRRWPLRRLITIVIGEVARQLLLLKFMVVHVAQDNQNGYQKESSGGNTANYSQDAGVRQVRVIFRSDIGGNGSKKGVFTGGYITGSICALNHVVIIGSSRQHT
jgi:hypothetical protein